MPLERRYFAYLLRLWRVNKGEHPDWQASLEDPHDGKQTGFADLASLFVYLKDQTQPDPMDEEIPGQDKGEPKMVRPCKGEG